MPAAVGHIDEHEGRSGLDVLFMKYGRAGRIVARSGLRSDDASPAGNAVMAPEARHFFTIRSVSSAMRWCSSRIGRVLAANAFTSASSAPSAALRKSLMSFS